MPTLDRAGVRIYYEVHGAGPALLLSHGFSATSLMWRPQIEALSRQHTLILWDMRGHGRSDSPSDDDAYGQKLTVADMAALLDHLGFEDAIVGGLSLGGYMSLAFYAAHPTRVKALLIIDTGPGFKNDEARNAWNDMALKWADAIDRRGAEALRGRSAEQVASQHQDLEGLVHAARRMLTQSSPEVIELLPEVRVPSLVVVGEEDRQFLNAADYMAEKIPGAQKVVLPNAGHAANLDQPEAFNAAVLAFLEDVED